MGGNGSHAANPGACPNDTIAISTFAFIHQIHLLLLVDEALNTTEHLVVNATNSFAQYDPLSDC